MPKRQTERELLIYFIYVVLYCLLKLTIFLERFGILYVQIEGEISSLSPPRKRVKRKALSKSEKEMILNVYKNALESNNEFPISSVEDKAARVTVVSKVSVFRVISKYKKCSELNSPKKTKSRKRALDNIDGLIRTL